MYKKNKDGGKVAKLDNEILRIRSTKTSLFEELNKILIERFEPIQNPNTSMRVFWMDSDDDRIEIQDQPSLLLAMESIGGPIYKLIVVLENKETPG